MLFKVPSNPNLGFCDPCHSFLFVFTFLLGLSADGNLWDHFLSPCGNAVGSRSICKQHLSLFCFLRSPEREDPGEELAPSALPGWTHSLERGSVSSELYSNVSFLNLDVGI